MGILRTCTLAASLVALVPTRALAEPRRLIVVDFDGGAKARELQDAVVKLLPAEQFTVLQIRKAADGELDEIAAKLGADVRVTGSLALDKRKHFILTVKVAGPAVGAIDSPGSAGARSDAERRGVSIDSPGEHREVSIDLGRATKLTKPAAVALKKKLLTHIEALPAKSHEPEPEPAPAPAPAPKPQVEVAMATSVSAEAPKPLPVEIVKQAPKPAPAFDNLGLHRPALPKNLITLRGYYDSRHVNALEQVIGFRAPLDFAFFGRTTLRTDTNAKSDLDTFAIDALFFSPMVYSIGLVVGVSGSSGTDNDAIRPGIGQTLYITRGPVRVLSMLAFEPYQTSGKGGRMQALVAVTVGPVRSEVVGVYGWPLISKISDPNILLVRPDFRVRVWKSFGVYGQYEYNNALMTGREGVRLGGELTGAF